MKVIKDDVESHVPKILNDIKELEQKNNEAEIKNKKNQIHKQMKKTV